MKKIMFTAIVILAIIFTACNGNSNKNNESVSTITISDSTQLYACSMHPEVIGIKDAECSKCGMKLSVPVIEEKKDSTASTK